MTGRGKINGRDTFVYSQVRKIYRWRGRAESSAFRILPYLVERFPPLNREKSAR